VKNESTAFQTHQITSDPVIVLTPGDPEGIGPEITWKILQERSKNQSKVAILCVGAKEPFLRLKAPLVEWDPAQKLSSPSSKEPFVWIYSAPEKAPSGKFLPGFQSGWAIEKATDLVLTKKAAALVTGPISKDRLQKGGYLYPGHTEFLAQLCGVPEVTMMLANSTLRVTLVTTHVGIKEVSSHLSREKIRRAVEQTVVALQRDWKITHPKIAVCALNPHAGESGLFGREEIEIIEPELQSLRLESAGQYTVEGPFPADTFFALHLLTSAPQRHDAVVCMYHDQGLIPVKLLDFHNTVNVTLGLPMIRTSVDHGVGFDIVGKGIANPASLRAAIELATSFIEIKA
jgi:4-hydroxythreonine-4-phosphate dehydrogenase